MRTKAIPIVLLLAFLVGCTTVFTGIVTLTQVVDTSMKAWADVVHQGRSTPALEAKVKQGYNAYLGACETAKNALIAYKLSGDPAQYQAAVAAAQAAATALVETITPLLTASKATTIKTQLSKAKVI